MNFVKTPVKGMPEHLPQDMEVREYAMRKIKETYRRFGFSLIETPAIEHIENLTNKQGGENEMLIFRILKRGDKLERANDVNDMCDSGLRYDLTVPLARFYANNKDQLPYPFKSLQIGSSWRADRPQKGRFRQFTQCDIDIIGDASNLAEIELITATAEMLHQLGMGQFVVRVNDRRLLRLMAAASGFPEESMDDVFIALDKIDKIGADGVKAILTQMNLDADGIESYMQFFAGGTQQDTASSMLSGLDAAADVVSNLDEIIACARHIIGDKGRVVFDPTLVRGMSYYTGPIFEIGLTDKTDMALSIAGGGRYDQMIGHYNNGKLQAPACGFSIGFERIISLLQGSADTLRPNDPSEAYLVDPRSSAATKQRVFKTAYALRESGTRVLVSPRQKNMSQQITMLRQQGYTKFYTVNDNEQREIRPQA